MQSYVAMFSKGQGLQTMTTAYLTDAAGMKEWLAMSTPGTIMYVQSHRKKEREK